MLFRSITSVLNGASYLNGIEAGSWVMIQGTNLANTYPGRTWRGDEVVNGNLPTALDGVSVTIDGKPAFVYYISGTQVGSVNVKVSKLAAGATVPFAQPIAEKSATFALVREVHTQ